MRTRELALSAMLTALSVVLLYAACLLPTGRLALLAVAAMLPAVAVLAGGCRWGLLVYGATTLLSLLLLPNRLPGLVYAVILGHYSVVKSVIERLKRPAAELILKLLVWNGTLAVAWGLAKGLGLLATLPYSPVLLVVLYNLAFLVYDLVFTQVITQIARYFR
jgi:hypothetical protein